MYIQYTVVLDHGATRNQFAKFNIILTVHKHTNLTGP